MKITVHLSNDFRKTCWVPSEEWFETHPVELGADSVRGLFELWCLEGTYDGEGFTFDAGATTYVTDLLELAFSICNSSPGELFCPQEWEEVVERYRKEGNRSLSVGDLVVVDGERYGVAGNGFVHVTSEVQP